MKSPLAAAVAAALLCADALLAVQAPQDPPPPVFRIQVDAVEIDAFITDGQGNPVTDLTADDFEILEDNRRQPITSFALVNIPLERAERPLYSPTAIDPDVHTNRGGEGRLYVIALDEVRPDLALRTRHFLRRFVEQHFAANDVGAVLYVGRGNAANAQDFTSSRRLLLSALDKFAGGFPQEALPSAAGATVAEAAALAGFAASRQRESELLTRARMRSLRELVEFMSGLRGRRKTIVYVTERLTEGAPSGDDVFGVLDYKGGARSIAFGDLHAALTAATRGNVSIYPVDPTGLSPEGALGDAEAAPEAAGATGLNRRQELRALAEATGGFALVNSNSYDAAFARIVRENSSYYVLGFTSTNDRRDGRYRRIQVRVRRPGLQVRARNGYVAPMGRPPKPEVPDTSAARMSPAVADSIGVPLENDSVPMGVFAAPFKGSGRDANVIVSVELDASRLGLVDTGVAVQGEIEVATAAIASTDKVYYGDRPRMRLTLRPDTYTRALGSSVRVLTQIVLPPGRYQLRIAGGNISGPAGSVMADLEVPDFTQDGLVMSGVALTSVMAAEAFTATAKNLLSDLLPAPATAVREFARGDAIAIYAEVYENLRTRATHTVSLKAELRSDEGRVIQTVDEDRSSTDLQGASGGYGFRAELPLEVDPGIYVIHVEARANIGDQPTVTRDIQIRVK
jgi:VWFA-related protein